MWELLFLLLPLAAFSGWWLGRRRFAVIAKDPLPLDYYLGFKHLLNEQTEMAVAAFSRVLDKSPATVETSLTLGALFQRRGEMDRAIGVHENLLKDETLTPEQREQAIFALAGVYFHSGMLDRAEALLEQLVKEGGKCCEPSQWQLLSIFEQEKDWNKAIDCALQIEKDPLLQRDKAIAHYFCEKAQQLNNSQDPSLIKECLENALHVDKNCVRASLAYAAFFAGSGAYQEAIRLFVRIEKQDSLFIPEMIGGLAHCYEHLGAEKALLVYLEQLVYRYPSTTVLLLYVRYLQKAEGEEAAARFVTTFVQQYPSIRGIGYLVAYHMRRATESTRDQLLLLQGLMEHLLLKKPLYRCQVCGFSSKSLHWQCPSCKRWETIKPIVGLEGE